MPCEGRKARKPSVKAPIVTLTSVAPTATNPQILKIEIPNRPTLLIITIRKKEEIVEQRRLSDPRIGTQMGKLSPESVW